MPTQVENGKAFEYALAVSYFKFLKDEKRLAVELVMDNPYRHAMRCYDIQSTIEKQRFDLAAQRTIETMVVIEPGLIAVQGTNDILKIHLAGDEEGEVGDVRDVVFRRLAIHPTWEIGFSAKNNHEAVKHSRLSMGIDFGESWLLHPCSSTYFEEIRPIFSWITELREANPQMKWTDLGENKSMKVYKPLLDAFRKEMLRLANLYPDVPQNLLSYLIGRKPFYKIIKDDKNSLVIVKAFNMGGQLNKTVNGISPKAKTDKIKFPKRIIELAYKESSDTTLIMVLDEGWQVSFRIHSASTYLENSLKFDIQLIGNPPVLFTQHLFNI